MPGYDDLHGTCQIKIGGKTDNEFLNIEKILHLVFVVYSLRRVQKLKW